MKKCTKLSNKVLRMTLILLLILNSFQIGSIPAMAATETNVTIGNVSGAPGSIVEVPVSISGVPSGGINNFNFAISFDSSKLDVIKQDGQNTKLDIVVPANGAIPAPQFLTCSTPQSGCIYAFYADDSVDNNKQITDQGAMFNIKFKIKDGAQSGDSAVEYAAYPDSSGLGTMFSVNVIDSQGNIGLKEIPVTFTAGTVRIVSYKPGDVNGDGLVDVSDYNLVKQKILGKITQFMKASDPTEVYEYGVLAADVNNDSSIDVSDYNLIKQIILGKIK